VHLAIEQRVVQDPAGIVQAHVLSMRITPVSRSTSIPQKSKTKP
jgi:hypothetical protein